RQLVLLFDWKPTVETVQELMHAEDTRAWDNWVQRPAEEIAAEWQRLAREDVLPRYIKFLSTAQPKIAGCLNLLKRIQPRPYSQMADKVRHLLDLVPRLTEARDLAGAVAELKELAKVGGEKAKAWPSDEDYRKVQEAFEDFRKELPARLEPFLDPA